MSWKMTKSQDDEDEEEDEDASALRFSLNNPFGKNKKQASSSRRRSCRSGR